jgi:transcriptional regulator with XRE-family HTH domain
VKIIGYNIDMRIRGERLVQAREARDLSQAELAAKLGIGRPRLGAWEVGRNGIPKRFGELIAAALDVPLEWLTSFDDDRVPEPRSAPAALSPGFDPPGVGAFPAERVGRRLFPLVGIAGAAAFPVPSELSDPEDYVEFSDALYVRGLEQFAVRVWGDSMEKRFFHGDFVLVTADVNFRAPGRCVVVCDPEGRYLVKGLFRDGEGWKLRPANPAYPECRMDDPGWSMVGYVTGWRRERGRGSYMEEGDRAGLTFD